MFIDPELATSIRAVVLVWLFCFGACLGSFLNVAIFRIPRECMSVFFPRRSFCPRCGRQLTWHDNIPILAWLRLRGRCAGCSQPISARYPLVELATALLFLWLGWRHLPAERVLEGAAWGVVAIHGAAGAALIVCAGIDIDERIIPDEVVVPGMLLTPLLLALVPAASPSAPLEVSGWAGAARELLHSPCAWWGIPGLVGPLAWLEALPGHDPQLHARLAGFGAAVLGAACGAGLLFLLGESFRRLLGRESMGFGDVKFMGFLGALVGPQGLGPLLLVALFSGSLVGVLHLLRSGRTSVSARDLEPAPAAAGAPTPGALPAPEPLGPFQRRLLRLATARAPVDRDEERVPLRPGGALLVRLATGDPHIPFGPFLALGAAVALYAPHAVPDLLRWWIA